MLREELKKGVEVVLNKRIELGGGFNINKYSKGIIEEVNLDKDSVVIKLNDYGVMVGNIQETLEGFDIKKQEEKVVIVKDSVDKKSEIKNILYNGKVTVVVLKDGGIGIATCHKEDEYDKAKGKEIATIKAKINSLENQLKQY